MRTAALFTSKLVVWSAAVVTLGTMLAAADAMAQSTPAAPLTPLSLEGDLERGQLLAETCKGCHGVPNYHNAYPSYNVPRLGGQNADYIEVALQGYRRGTRGHTTMQAQAASLTDQDIADVAAYFASLQGEPDVGRSAADQAEIEEGRRKAVACVQCHGQEGVAAATQWPNLAGQHESYLQQALTQYKNGTRADMVMGPMAAPLDESTIEQLAAFFASQPLLHDTPRQ